jgi:hypothetical protein
MCHLDLASDVDMSIGTTSVRKMQPKLMAMSPSINSKSGSPLAIVRGKAAQMPRRYSAHARMRRNSSPWKCQCNWTFAFSHSSPAALRWGKA